MILTYKERYHTPVVAYVEGLCASGGMYIASSADEIYSSPSGVIGSVGVITGPFFNVYDLMQKVGLQAKTITQGIDKDELNPTRPWKPDEGSTIGAITAFLYNRFVDVVTTGRPNINREKLVQEYGARVFNCVEAEKLGYIDHAMSSRDEALLSLLAKANIDPTQPYQVVTLSPKAPWVAELLSSQSPLFSGKIEHQFIPFEASLRQQPCYLYQYE
jgi:ClpP class serine protease